MSALRPGLVVARTSVAAPRRRVAPRGMGPASDGGVPGGGNRTSGAGANRQEVVRADAGPPADRAALDFAGIPGARSWAPRVQSARVGTSGLASRSFRVMIPTVCRPAPDAEVQYRPPAVRTEPGSSHAEPLSWRFRFRLPPRKLAPGGPSTAVRAPRGQRTANPPTLLPRVIGCSVAAVTRYRAAEHGGRTGPPASMAKWHRSAGAERDGGRDDLADPLIAADVSRLSNAGNSEFTDLRAGKLVWVSWHVRRFLSYRFKTCRNQVRGYRSALHGRRSRPDHLRLADSLSTRAKGLSPQPPGAAPSIRKVDPRSGGAESLLKG